MDEFINTVESQSYLLNGFDEACSSIYIPFYYWYENPSTECTSWDAFMPPEILCSSFYKTLQRFPILAGRFMADKDGRGYVNVNSDSLNMPVYTDCTWNISFKHVQKAGFNTGLFSKKFDSACGIPTATRLGTVSAKLGVFHVRRFKNFGGVVIFASIAHAVVDGHGLFAFVNRWAETSRWMQQAFTEKKLTLSVKTFEHDRSFHKSYIAHGTNALDGLTLRSAANGNVLSKLFSYLPVDKRNILLKLSAASSQLVCYTFQVSSLSLTGLRNSVQKHAPYGIRYSTNDIITALLTMVVGQAIQKVNVKKESTFFSGIKCVSIDKSKESLDTLTAVAVNMRPHINNPIGAHFVGNLSFARSILSSHVLVQAETNPENLSAVATNIRKGVAAMGEEYFSQLNNLLNKHIDAHMRLAMHTAKYKNRLMVSNISKYSHYKTDFGAGNPILVRPTLLSFPNVILVMPSRPDSDFDGYEIIISLDKDTAKLVFEDKYWMDLVDSYSYNV